MKKMIVKAFCFATIMSCIGLMLTGCPNAPTEEPVNPENSGNSEVYNDFTNYPTGKQDATGLLTLKNQISDQILVFTDSVAPQNYIGTIPALEQIRVKLTPGKFYNIVTVSKSNYEANPTIASRTSKLTYYSDTQAYTVSVSADNLTGGATWIFNNNTNYWVSVEHTDNSGETYAVVAPNAKRVSIPVSKNRSYPYKLVYKKELRYQNNTIAVADKTDMRQNDEASFYENDSFTTDLNGDVTPNEWDDLAPTIKFINNSSKTVRVYNGQKQLTNAGIVTDDYTQAAGITAFFTDFVDRTRITGLSVRSVAWNGKQDCTETTMLYNGKVYTVEIRDNPGSDSAENPILWTVVSEEDASEFFAAN